MARKKRHPASRDYSEIKKTHLPKTIYFHLEDDADIVQWLQKDAKPNASEATRRILRHYISTGQDNMPAGAPVAAVDPDSIRQAVAEAMAEAMGDIRAIVQAAVDTALAGRVVNAGDMLAQPAGLLNGNGNGNGRVAEAALDKLALALDDDDL